MAGLLRRVAVGGGITLLSMILVKAMAFVNSIIAARLLTPSDFGAFSVVLNLEHVAVIMACFGIPLALTKHVSQWLSSDLPKASAVGSALLAMLLISAGVTTVGYLLLARLISVDLYGSEDLVMPIALSAALAFTASINLGMSSLLQGCQRIRALAKINAIIAVVTQPLMLALIWILDLEGAIISLALMNGFSAVLLFSRVQKVLSISTRNARQVLGEKRQMRSLLSFTVPAFASSLLIVAAFWIGRTVLALERDFSMVGQFQIAESLSAILLIVPAAVSVPLLPLVSEQNATNPREVGKFSGRLLTLAAVFALPLSLIAFPLVDPLIEVLYGAGYLGASAPAALMLASSTFIAIGAVVSNTIIGVGRMWDALLLNVAWLLVFLPAAVILVSAWGAEGLAGAYAISYGIYLSLLLGYFSHRFQVPVARMGCLISGYAPFAASYVLLLRQESLPLGFGLMALAAVLFAIVGIRFVLDPQDRDRFARLLTRRG